MWRLRNSTNQGNFLSFVHVVKRARSFFVLFVFLAMALDQNEYLSLFHKWVGPKIVATSEKSVLLPARR